MTDQINDIMFEKLDALGYVGALPEKLDEFKDANAPWLGWDAFLTAQGYGDGHISDRKSAYWSDLVPPP